MLRCRCRHDAMISCCFRATVRCRADVISARAAMIYVIYRFSLPRRCFGYYAARDARHTRALLDDVYDDDARCAHA